jgi:predicted PurR-regulated permease PerM
MRNKSIEAAFFTTLLVASTVVFIVLLKDFFQPLFWAAVLGIIFYPVHTYVLKFFQNRDSVAAAITLVIIIFVVIVPIFLVGAAVTREAASIYQQISSGEINLREPLERLENMLPLLTSYLEQFGIEPERIREGVSGAAITTSQFLASRAVNFGQGAVRITIMFFVMVYLLFFFLRDGEEIVEAIVSAMPLGQQRERALFSKFAQVSRATIKGTIVVGLVQGGLGGLLFWAVGIDAALLWGVVMIFLALFPAIGTVIIWGPAAIILLVSGALVRGIIVIIAGTLIIGLVDNVLRPILVSHETKMPDYLILLSTLGGLTLFGVSGFVIGPIIAGLFLVIWQMFVREYSTSLQPTEDQSPATGPDS